MIELLNIEEKKQYYKTIQVNGKQVRLHRYLMERNIGRKLTFNEVVHHIDGDIYNNSLSNLEIVQRSEHIRLHPEIQSKSIAVKTKYFIDKDFLNELFAVKRLTIKEISKNVNIPMGTIFHYIRQYGIIREDIFCNCGAKLKYSKTMMCNYCRTKHNRQCRK